MRHGDQPTVPSPPVPDGDLDGAVVARLREAGCVFAEEEAHQLVAAATSPAALVDMVDRRVTGVPLEHIIGRVEFCGLQLIVEPGVFVPRRRTEFLVRQATALAAPDAVVVDMCCGSGAVGVAVVAALAGTRPVRELYAVDVDPAAVRCAQRNLARVDDVQRGRDAGGNTRALAMPGDLYRPLPVALRGRISILIANAPYVPRSELPLMPPEARLHEPAVALDGGEDGLDVQRRIAAEAARWLAPAGHLLLETSRRQAPRSLELLTRHGLVARVTRCDESDTTVVIGRVAQRRGGRSATAGREADGFVAVRSTTFRPGAQPA